MQNFKNILLFFFSFSVAIFVWGVANLFLVKTPVFYVSSSKDYNFFRINLTPLFFHKNKSAMVIKKIETLNGITLKALYKNGKDSFIAIEDKGKTEFVNLNSYYKGYKLIQIKNNYAIFNRNGRNYKISFKKEKVSSLYKETPNNYMSNIPEKVFKTYKNNLSKIWSNIGIIKTKEGYKITYVKPNSIFTKIGLRRGDLIVAVNGRKLKNDADAWNLYKHIDNFNEIEIEIKRNNQIKVLDYEIY